MTIRFWRCKRLQLICQQLVEGLGYLKKRLHVLSALKTCLLKLRVILNCLHLSFKAFTFSSIGSGEFSQPFPVNPCKQTQIFLPSGQKPCPLQIGSPGHVSRSTVWTVKSVISGSTCNLESRIDIGCRIKVAPWTSKIWYKLSQIPHFW